MCKFCIIFLFSCILFVNLFMCCDGKFPEKLLCASSNCSDPISTAVAFLNYHHIDDMMMSFRKGEKMLIYSKSARVEDKLWGAKIKDDARSGFIPSDFVKEISMIHKGPLVTVVTDELLFGDKDINTNLNENEVVRETSYFSGVAAETISEKPSPTYEVIDGTSIPVDNEITSSTVDTSASLKTEYGTTPNEYEADVNEDLTEGTGFDIFGTLLNEASKLVNGGKSEVPDEVDENEDLEDEDDEEDDDEEDEETESTEDKEMSTVTPEVNPQEQTEKPVTVTPEAAKLEAKNILAVSDQNKPQETIQETVEMTTLEPVITSEELKLSQDIDGGSTDKSVEDSTPLPNEVPVNEDLVTESVQEQNMTINDDLLMNEDPGSVGTPLQNIPPPETPLQDDVTASGKLQSQNDVLTNEEPIEVDVPVNQLHDKLPITEGIHSPEVAATTERVQMQTGVPGNDDANQDGVPNTSDVPLITPDVGVPSNFLSHEGVPISSYSLLRNGIQGGYEAPSHNEVPSVRKTEVNEETSVVREIPATVVGDLKFQQADTSAPGTADPQVATFQPELSPSGEDTSATVVPDPQASTIQPELSPSDQDTPGAVVPDVEVTQENLRLHEDINSVVSDEASFLSNIFDSLLSVFGTRQRDEPEAEVEREEDSERAAIVEEVTSPHSPVVMDGTCKSVIGLESDCLGETIVTDELNNYEKLTSSPASYQTFIYLAVTSVTLLVFTLGYFLIEKFRQDGPLIAKINNLEQELLVAAKENSILKDDLENSRSEFNNTGELVASVDHQLLTTVTTERDCLKMKTAELEAQVESLQQELDSATEAGLELNKMLTEVFSQQHDAESLLMSVEKLQSQLDVQQTTISDMNQRLNSKNAENEVLQSELSAVQERAQQLDDELSEVKDNLGQLTEERQQVLKERDLYKLNVGEMEVTVTNTKKQNELMELKLKELNERLLTKESEVVGLRETLTQVKTGGDDCSLDVLFDVGSMKAELARVVRERDVLKEKVSDEEGARKLLESHVKSIDEEVRRLRLNYEEAEREKVDAQTKLQVLSNYFKEKETQLQKELGLQEAMWVQKQGDESTIFERMKSLEHEVENYNFDSLTSNESRSCTSDNQTSPASTTLELDIKFVANAKSNVRRLRNKFLGCDPGSQNEILKKEILDQERGLKGQIATLEKKAHENWIAARQAERKLEESKQEAGQLRNRLTLIEKNIVGGDIEGKIVNRSGEELNGSGEHPLLPDTSSPLLFPPIPLEQLPPGFIPPFMPPPPPPPFLPGDRRPPPLGRMSSPPPPPHLSNNRFTPPSPDFERLSPAHLSRNYHRSPHSFDDPEPRDRFRRSPSFPSGRHWEENHARPAFRPVASKGKQHSKGANLSSGHSSSESLDKSSRSGKV